MIRKSENSTQKIQIGIYIFEGVELLDFAGPFEVFSNAGILHHDLQFEVNSIAQNEGLIRTYNGAKVLAEKAAKNCRMLDLLVICGGEGTKRLIENEEEFNALIELLHRSARVLSICSGARILAKAGMLKAKSFCTHKSVYEEILFLEPTAKAMGNKRFVVEGNIVTSAGVSAGIDASLYVLEEMSSPEIALEVARYMEYARLQ
jgi:transcriptional regulator GlxA family with amidase domain